ncbi:hypothetical protein SteCoe_25387 [Stentor coeruleus]|uniref:Uncharacterized protein n=1 Tax=Stentor coeruleus TaxID=5963 RepID=A0A1R2BFQ0_9CILI|nr:hypothetical protein SteCoe_25387 [Stentor coeruleus]
MENTEHKKCIIIICNPDNSSIQESLDQKDQKNDHELLHPELDLSEKLKRCFKKQKAMRNKVCGQNSSNSSSFQGSDRESPVELLYTSKSFSPRSSSLDCNIIIEKPKLRINSENYSGKIFHRKPCKTNPVEITTDLNGKKDGSCLCVVF